MKLHILVLPLSLFFLINLHVMSQETNNGPRPNVLIIYTDDQGTVDINALGVKRFIHSKYGCYC